jgi:serine O-acetyltransferase
MFGHALEDDMTSRVHALGTPERRSERAGNLPHVNLPHVVAELRRARALGKSARGPGRPDRPLPSREAVGAIVDGLRKALFPTHFGSPELTDAGVDFFVGHTLDATLRLLLEQTRNTLVYESCELPVDGAACSKHAVRLVAGFAAKLPEVRAILESDIHAAHSGDPAAKSRAEIMFCYPGLFALIHHRLAHELYRLGLPLLSRIIAERAHASTGIDIHPGAQIGPRFFIDHGTGVVVGETARIGANVRLYQGVTLGAASAPPDARGAAPTSRPRHPVVEDDVIIYAGATVLGRVTIGRGATIGGNVWLTRDVAPYARVSQAQAHQETFEGGAGI